ncbi:MAG: hypothetical protein ABIN48_10465 [Ginsengibacter sp.]
MKHLAVYFFASIFCLSAYAQQITYSQPESSDSRSLNFEIIGKVEGNFLIYKNNRNNHNISVYDNSMRMIDKTELLFMGDKTLNVDFISYPDYAWIIYQYQKRNIVYNMAVKVNGKGKLLIDPIELDTTSINFFADNKIYSTIYSEDKSKVMIYKIQKKNEKFNFTTLLFDSDMKLIKRSRIETDYEDRKNVFSDFLLTNQGNFVFSKGDRSSSRDFIKELYLVSKAPQEDTFALTQLELGDYFLDEIKLKVDNLNNTYIINSFFYTKRRGNVEGLFTGVINEGNNEIASLRRVVFGDQARAAAKDQGASKTALNDYFIREVILKRDGGFILTAEDFYSQSRSNPWNRYDYLYGYPSFSSPYYYNYYSPYSYGYYGNRFYDYNSQTRYYYNNIFVMSMDNTGKLEWTSVLHKTQFDDGNDNFLSYALMRSGGELHFLFNEIERRRQLLVEQSVTPDGEIIRNPPLRSLDKGYEFMPRYAKQVSANQMIVPCTYRNYICFAKIDF